MRIAGLRFNKIVECFSAIGLQLERGVLTGVAMRRMFSRSVVLFASAVFLVSSQIVLAEYPDLTRQREGESGNARSSSEASESWGQFNQIASEIKSSDRFVRNRGLTRAFHIWKADPHPPGSLDEGICSDLRAAFSGSVEDLNAVGRINALQFLSAIGARSPGSVRLVLVCLADEDADVRALAAKAGNVIFSSGKDEAAILEAARVVLEENQDDRVLCAAASGYVSRMGEKGRSIAADLAIGQLASVYRETNWFFRDRTGGKADGMVAVPHPSGAKVQAIEHALAIGPPPVVLPYPYESEAAAINRALADGPKAAEAKIVELIGDSRTDELRMKLAKLVVKESSRFNRHAIVVDLLGMGFEFSPQVLKAMQLDVAAVMPLLAKLLQEPRMPVVLVTLHALKTIGLDGDEIRKSLAVLLDSRNDAVLYAAADLLGRQDILKRSIIPQLLEDLRSESPDRRSIAARQLDELKLEPEILTKALIRAVDRRDMAARTGLISAVESAYYTRGDCMEMLKRDSERRDDVGARNFARAALREMDLTRAQNDAK